MPFGIVMIDDAKSGFRIAACNPAAAELLEDEAAAGRAVESFFERSAELVAALRENTDATPEPLTLPLKANPQRSIAIHPVRIDGGNPHVLHLTDVTEQVRLETQFAQSQKMQAVGQLAGGIAHDFNNLLTAMIGFCDLLLQRFQPGEQVFADVMQIKQNANRGARLVRQLLAFSRRQTLQPRVLAVSDVLAELTSMLKRLVGDDIDLSLIHGRDLGAVLVDQGQLEQVIINLVVNARDAMDAGGRLEIETFDFIRGTEPLAGRDMMPPGNYVAIRVSDTGVGIEDENLERIFDPFFTTKEVGSGTGLGLATVYGIIKQTGGFVFAESAGTGAGARFIIYLPCHEGEAATTPVIEASRAATDLTGGGTVLLVEDEDPVRLFGARALRSKGYKVVEAHNGEVALELLRDENFDLLITDMIMPNVNGAAVIAAARKSRPELPVICISGHTEESMAKEMDNFADLRFLAKPFSLQDLAGMVKDAIADGDRPAGPTD
ncbi:MAG TPA: hybrid sensor histidine kinase/response regulator [Rhodospirillaceae bacterium]|nr:hybrid sensor histidine kinase/response regulator [Rhodospirillaceae bacterium]